MWLLGLFERRFVVGARFGDLRVTLALQRHNLVVAVTHQLLGLHLRGQRLVLLGVGALVHVRVPEIRITRFYNTENTFTVMRTDSQLAKQLNTIFFIWRLFIKLDNTGAI